MLGCKSQSCIVLQLHCQVGRARHADKSCCAKLCTRTCPELQTGLLANGWKHETCMCDALTRASFTQNLTATCMPAALIHSICIMQLNCTNHSSLHCIPLLPALLNMSILQQLKSGSTIFVSRPHAACAEQQPTAIHTCVTTCSEEIPCKACESTPEYQSRHQCHTWPSTCPGPSSVRWPRQGGVAASQYRTLD